jgi:hypothetical protein
LIVAGAIGLVYGLDAAQDITAVRTPALVLSRDRLTFAILTVSIALTVAAAIALIAGLGKYFDVRIALVGGLTYGLATAVTVAAGRTAWAGYFRARCRLALTRRTPWSLVAFLSDAHSLRGVLRQNGATYQFRHLDLQRRLASTYDR